MEPSSLRIGTAGWSVPSQYADDFPAEGSHLQRYAAVMNTVEINTSFYRPHRRTTYERWAAATPPDFRFSVKAPRLLTHDQRLADPQAGLDRFAEETAGLGGKLSVVLVQLPPSLAFDPNAADGFFAALRARIPAAVACEPRHASWFTDEAEAFLTERRIARVMADPAPTPGAERPGGWEGLVYVRLHGSPRIYYSAYETDFLARTRRLLDSRQATGAQVWCVLDNTAASAALGDALTLMRL
jgi:uncharacterized protein YecE (DUF72 family)